LPAPEPGELQRRVAVGSVFLRNTATIDSGRLRINITHRNLWFPPATSIGGLATTDAIALANALAKELPSSTNSRLRSVIAHAERQRDINPLRRSLTLISHCYRGEQEALLQAEGDELKLIARLLGITLKDTDRKPEQVRELILGVGGWRVMGSFRPIKQPTQPTSGLLRGEVGRLVLRGTAETGNDAWFRIETGQREAPKVLALELPTQMRFFVVHETDFRGVWIRLQCHGESAPALITKLELYNPHGKEQIWIELVQQPPADDVQPH
jgi:hypothetical protein